MELLYVKLSRPIHFGSRCRVTVMLQSKSNETNRSPVPASPPLYPPTPTGIHRHQARVQDSATGGGQGPQISKFPQNQKGPPFSPSPADPAAPLINRRQFDTAISTLIQTPTPDPLSLCSLRASPSCHGKT